MFTIQNIIGINSNYFIARVLTRLGCVCLLGSVITIGFNYWGFHYSVLFFAWVAMVALVYRFVARFINSNSKAGWAILVIAMVCFAAAYYYVLLNILPDLGADPSDVF